MGQAIKTGQPIVILVRPQLGENIGAACRAMLNFGLTELRLVEPRDGWPNPAADSMAAGALSHMQIRTYSDLGVAIGDLHYVLAASARRRDMEIETLESGDLGAKLQTYIHAGRLCGVVFGPEKAGLLNADVSLCDAMVHYPVNKDFASLNLAQAVNILAYVWAQNAVQPTKALVQECSPISQRKDMLHLFSHLEDELEAGGFFYPPEKKSLMVHNIRAPLIRAQMREQEIRTFRGIIKALAQGRGRPKRGV